MDTVDIRGQQIPLEIVGMVIGFVCSLKGQNRALLKKMVRIPRRRRDMRTFTRRELVLLERAGLIERFERYSAIFNQERLSVCKAMLRQTPKGTLRLQSPSSDPVVAEVFNQHRTLYN